MRANKPVASYSQGYRIGQFVFVSGQMPVDPETNETVEGGSAEHTRQCLKNVFGVLEEAGCTYRDVGQAVVYMTNIDEIDAMDAVWQEFFPDPNNYCSRAVIGISKLVVGARIEISCIAIKD
jgi:2-iminobutanoate/2-iminopropanoate deaminase